MRALPPLVCLGLLAALASADLDADLVNGDRVVGTISPKNEVESFRVALPKGAKLYVTAKPRKTKPRPFPPEISLTMRDVDNRVMSGVVEEAGRGSRVKGFVVPRSGTYTIEVRGDGFDIGDYRLNVRWKPIRKWKLVDLGLAGGVDVPFSGDVDALLAFDVRAAKQSAAQPWVTELRDAGGATVFSFAAPDGDRHVEKETRLLETADYSLHIVDRQGNGTARGVLKLKPPRSPKRKIGLTLGDLGDVPPDVDLIATILADSRGGGANGDGSNDPDADRIAIEIDEGVFKKVTALQIGFADPMQSPPQSGLLPAGRTVYAGPDDVTFPQIVDLTIPYEPDVFVGDTSTLRVVRRDPSGSFLTLPTTNLDIDPATETVTFPAGRTGTYAAFRLYPPPRVESVFPFRGNDDGGYEISIFGGEFRDFDLPDGKHVLALTIDGVPTDATVVRVNKSTFVTFIAPSHATGFVTFGVLDRETELLTELPANSFEYF